MQIISVLLYYKSDMYDVGPEAYAYAVLHNLPLSNLFKDIKINWL